MLINAGDLQFELHQDVALYIISKLSTSGATGYFVEYAEKFWKHDMEGRMTVCNKVSKWALVEWLLQIKRLLII
jgi:3-isopropylmalate/(R)-2-methylmalate dehydratase large subunit